MNTDRNTKKLVIAAMIAGIYAALTIGLAPISYGALQFRISEILVLLAFINTKYIIPLTVGCFIANFLGPNGLLDIIFGTLATFLSCVAMSQTKKILNDNTFSFFIASLWPSIINGLIIGYMLYKAYNLPLILSIVQIIIGEFVVVTVIGLPFWNITRKKFEHII